jgi:tetratricopeptide (TPR) repeat protein
MAKGEIERAIADCDRALKLDTQNADAWNSRGLARQGKGDLDGALADFDRAIALNPQQAAFYGNRGKAWLLKGEIERALSDLNRALRSKPLYFPRRCRMRKNSAAALRRRQTTATDRCGLTHHLQSYRR